MLHYPVTLEQAKKVRYGGSAGYPRSPYRPERCAEEVGEPPHYFHSHQCHRGPGHGPARLYCKQHAKRVEEQMRREK